MKETLKKTAIITFFVVIGLLLMGWVFKQISFQEMIDIFVKSNHTYTVLFLLISVLIMSIHTLRWKMIIKSSGYKVPFFKLLQYKIAGSGISFLTPGAKVGGEPVRAILLKNHNIKFHKGLSTVITDKIVELSVQGVLFVAAAMLAVFTMAMPSNMNIIIIIFSVVSIYLIVYVYYQIFNDNNLFLKWFRKLGLNKIKKLEKSEKKIIEFEKIIVKFHKEDSKDFYYSVFLTLITWFLMFGEYYFAAQMLGFDLTIKQIFIIISAMGAAYLIPIPMALGVFEAGEMTIFKMLKLSATAGVSLAIIIRARDLIWSILVLPILFFNGMKIKDVKEDVAKEKSKEVSK